MWIMEIASRTIKIEVKLSAGRQIESEEVKCLREISERPTSWYPVHLQTIEAFICTSWSKCNLYQVDWLAFSFNLVPSSPIVNAKYIARETTAHASHVYMCFSIWAWVPGVGVRTADSLCNLQCSKPWNVSLEKHTTNAHWQYAFRDVFLSWSLL